MKNKLRVAVVGAGLMGSDHVERLANRIVGAEVAAVVDVDVERARQVASKAPGARTSVLTP
jgi:myo-inositol 2-dehydrogenase / D-chiro-inositol 1-dehydrogenase